MVLCFEMEAEATCNCMWHLFPPAGPVCIEAGRVRRRFMPKAVLSGSFNPLHRGHLALAQAAAVHLGVAVDYELSITNADKPELSRAEVEWRVSQFEDVGPVWVTRAATFDQKAELFPGATFVLGWDTAVRVIDPRYYEGEVGRDAALRRLLAYGCRFLVGGRLDATGVFRVWDAEAVMPEFAPLFVALSEADFRVDVSSTQLRGVRGCSA